MRRRRLNVRLAVMLALITICVVAAVHAAHEFQVRRIASVVQQRAQQAVREGLPRKAIELYEQYLEYRPDDREAAAALALMQADQSEWQSDKAKWNVYLALEQAAARSPDNEVVARRLVELALAVGRFDEAVDLVKQLIKRHPDDTGLSVLLGLARSAKEQYPQAVAAFETALAKDPKCLEAYVHLATLLADGRAADSGVAEADKVLDRMVVANASSALAYVYRASFFERTGRPEKAVADVRKAQALGSEQLEVLLVAARVAMHRHNLFSAEKDLAQAQAIAPHDWRVHECLSRLRQLQGRLAEAVEELKTAIGPADIPIAALRWQLRLAKLYLAQPDVKTAIELIRQMRRIGQRPEIIGYLEARLMMLDQNWSQAAQSLERLAPYLERIPEFREEIGGFRLKMRLAECYERLNLNDLRVDALRHVVSDQPGVVQGRMALAGALARVGRLDEAMREFGRLLATLGWLEFLRLPALRSDYFQLLILRAERGGNESDWKELDEFATQLDRVAEIGDVEKVLIRATLLGKKGEPGKARKLLAAAWSEHPKEPQLPCMLAEMIARTDGAKAGLAVLDRAVGPLGDPASLRLTRARLAAQLPSEEGRRQLALLAQGVEKFAQADRQALWETLGASHLQLHDLDQARDFWIKISEENPFDSRMRLQLFELARQTGDESLMQRWTEEIRHLMGSASAEWCVLEASRLVWLARNQPGHLDVLDRVAELLRTARRVRPAWREVLVVQGDLAGLYAELGRISTARRMLSELALQSPTDLRATGTLVALMLEQKCPAAQIAPHLERLKKLDPKSRSMQLLVARYLAVTGKKDEAARALEAMIPRPLSSQRLEVVCELARLMEESDLADLASRLYGELVAASPAANLPWAEMLGRRGMVHEAFAHCEAATLAKVPMVKVLAAANGILLVNRSKVSSQEIRRVESWLDRARKETPEDRVLQVQVAIFLGLQGRYEQEQAIYQALLFSDEVSARERAFLANNLAYRLACGEMGVEQWAEAATLVEQAVKMLGPTPEVLDTRGLVRLADGKTEGAIADFQEAIADRPSGIKYFHLALAFQAAGHQAAAEANLGIAQTTFELGDARLSPPERERLKRLTMGMGKK